MERSPRVVIVGAGISAVAAANLLVSEGINDIVLLEATDRVGGRIWSVDLGEFDGCPARRNVSCVVRGNSPCVASPAGKPTGKA